MENRIRKMYRGDCCNIIFWILFLWLVITFVFFKGVNSIATDYLVRITTLVIGGLAVTFATAALIAVIVHLRKNLEDLYIEDIKNLQRMKHRLTVKGE